MNKSVQSDPPFFGKAKFVNPLISNFICKIRKKKSEIILNSNLNNQLVKNKISIVILSCKRLNSLQRLCSSLRYYLECIEVSNNYEVILVDNGSGQELIKWAKSYKFFNKIFALENNIGMCKALNYVYQKLTLNLRCLLRMILLLITINLFLMIV